MSGAEALDELVAFQDPKKTYTLQRPKNWEQVDKAGADALFKAPNLKSTDLGVTVSPIRIQRLDQLGDVTAVGDRLLAAERKKVNNENYECALFRLHGCVDISKCTISPPFSCDSCDAPWMLFDSCPHTPFISSCSVGIRISSATSFIAADQNRLKAQSVYAGVSLLA